ncbi:hypothetical protein QE374_001294 [Microbacterium sp. SORGH_AS428]|uniref:hypothetical protein n=1 Tax=Microbacterium sp. SORGH_AS_0428 TaxID=3041788 RepID=UPI00285E146B|nr:hypothetical protein [Microbacterium sp. SORGH_AS_0428]MDR6199385.1 hypothetical protein [Microbacterium sp. SORGH_AS_0428]
MGAHTMIQQVPGAAPRALWVQVEDGLHVASTAVAFVGTVTENATGFEAVDGLGTCRGVFASLDDAKAVLEAAAYADAII